MNAVRCSVKRGFTLVEILIVVIILGILAAIVIPQFTSASSDARNNSTKSLLQTLRSQIELYKLQHGDQVPDLSTDWSELTGQTTFGSNTFGPYLQQTPVNPQNGLSTVEVVTTDAATPSAAVGFVFNSTNGRIWATDSAGTAIFAE